MNMLMSKEICIDFDDIKKEFLISLMLSTFVRINWNESTHKHS